jgi:hypothetical protein
MPIATFRGEKTVAEIADKLFVKLTPKQREQAAAALLKENPQLREIAAVPEGAVLRMPDLPELRLKTTRSLDNPDTLIARDLADTLAAYGERLAERTNAEQAAIKAQRATLGSAALREALANAPAWQAVAEQAHKALDTRAATLDERQKATAAAIRKALAALSGKR